ncbi:MAG: DEAD/DEAH box helicase [Austwickia sp.]|nr:DEAD/DEAH box helicase [Austwickia sp.]
MKPRNTTTTRSKPRWTPAEKAAARAARATRRGAAPSRGAAKAARDQYLRREDRPDARPASTAASQDRRRDARTPYRRDDRAPYQRDDRRPERRDDRAPYRRDDRAPYQRDDRTPYRRDDRTPYRRDDRTPYRRDDRAPYQRDDRRPDRRDDRTPYQRRDDRSERTPYQRRDDRTPYRRDDRSESANRWDKPAKRRPSEAGPARRPHRPDPHADRIRRQEPTRRDAPDHGPAVDPPVGADNAFLTLGLPEVLVRRLARDGIAEPFPIQAATIPDALAGRDVLGRGRTGSGKTLAFGLPTLARLADGGPAAPKRPRALVLVPTRELAIQVSDALEPLAHVIGVRHKLVAGGLAYATQFAALERGVDLLIATPGRLLDLVEREAVALDDVRVAILDEADHMADMGFLPDVTALLDMIPPGGQRLLFSATLDKGIDELVARYLIDPVEHATDAATASVTTMAHHVLLVDPAHKKIVTAQVANRDGRTIVFVRTKLGADRVAREIREQGVLAAALHGGLNQGARNRVLAAFRDGRMPVLVATDVAARGIHVDDVSVVLQVDPPGDAKDYLHRAGRTARAGEQGSVVTLALPHQRRTIERLVSAAGVEVTPVRVGPGDEELLSVTGARRTSGVPVAEEAYQRIVEGPPRKWGPRRGGPPGAGRGSGGRGPGAGRDGDRRRMKDRRAG